MKRIFGKELALNRCRSLEVSLFMSDSLFDGMSTVLFSRNQDFLCQLSKNLEFQADFRLSGLPKISRWDYLILLLTKVRLVYGSPFREVER